MQPKRFPLLAMMVLGLFTLVSVTTPAAEEEKKEKKKGGPKAVATNLDNPSGVVVHSGTGHIFVAAHDGVHRITPKGKKNERVKLEVSGFPTDIYGKGPKYEIGPLGVAFLDDSHLVVGDGSRKDGSELIRIYKVGETAPDKPQKEDGAVYTLGPIGPSEDSPKGEGNFYGIAVGAGAIFSSSNGDDTKGWVLKAAIEGGKPGKLTPFIKTKVATGVDAPVGVTFSPNGEQLVVSQMGEMNVPKDSLLTCYNPKSGELIKKYKTGLHDIAGVAYHPKSGKLYAVDYAWIKNEDGGLFELEVAGDEVKATKIASLDRPSALAFDKKGNLYVTVFGWGKNKKGAVVRFAASTFK